MRFSKDEGRTAGSKVKTGLFAAAGLIAMTVMLAPVGVTAAEQGTDAWEKEPYIVEDGKVDFGTYNGYRRYSSYCHVCHGPDGLGSSYAPALADSLKTMSYAQFLEVVVNGRQVVNTAKESVMPAFGEVTDVMLYIDDIYAYLKARANGVIGRGRPKRLAPENDPVFQERKGD